MLTQNHVASTVAAHVAEGPDSVVTRLEIDENTIFDYFESTYGMVGAAIAISMLSVGYDIGKNGVIEST